MIFNDQDRTQDIGGFAFRQAALQDRIGRISDLNRLRLGVAGRSPNAVQGRSSTPAVATGGKDFEGFLASIAQQESGGRYNAVGVPTKHGRALGKYQVLDSNLASWGREAVGRPVTRSEFLGSPQLQESIARHKLQQYYNKYGPEGAAKAWYGGEGAARRSSNRRQGAFPSLNAYAAAVARRLRG